MFLKRFLEVDADGVVIWKQPIYIYIYLFIYLFCRTLECPRRSSRGSIAGGELIPMCPSVCHHYQAMYQYHAQDNHQYNITPVH